MRLCCGVGNDWEGRGENRTGDEERMTGEEGGENGDRERTTGEGGGENGDGEHTTGAGEGGEMGSGV